MRAKGNAHRLRALTGTVGSLQNIHQTSPQAEPHHVATEPQDHSWNGDADAAPWKSQSPNCASEKLVKGAAGWRGLTPGTGFSQQTSSEP